MTNLFMKIEDLKEIGEKLTLISDEMNKNIVLFEEQLKTFNIGIQVFVDITPNTQLGYGRLDSKDWHLIIKTKQFEQTEVWPLANSPRGLRLLGYKHMYEIIPALKSAALVLCEQIETALKMERL